MKEQTNIHTAWNKLKGMAKGLAAWSNKSFGSGNLRKDWRGSDPVVPQGAIVKKKKRSNASYASCLKERKSWPTKDLGWNGFRLGTVIHPFSM
jgi:hypothetical protein